MEYKAPSYEEYIKASEFAKLRYRFGVYIQLIAALLLLLLLFYTVTNIEEMKANPIDYAQEKMNVICQPIGIMYIETYDGSYRNINSIEEK